MIRVASYCRVSTDHEDQANSFESQQRFFREYIDRHPEWELCGVYADEGITGTSTKRRTQFLRMINDAYAGKFKLIVTKEVSRFSRNLLDTIAYTRELKALGIGIIFMNDGFSTLDPDAELRLSIMGSIAQEESRKTSARVKWGQTRQMERGVVFGPSLLGFDVRGGKLTVNDEGAEIVRLIFHKYGVENKGTSTIARELREAGYRTCRDNVIWSGSHIVKILRNEKYVGDLVQKKTFTPDYLTHGKKCNRGEEEIITIRNHHEPIIDRELWDTVQAELQKRNRQNGNPSGHSNRHVFSGKIICGECGAGFVSRTRTRRDGSAYMRWGCYTAATLGVKTMDAQGNLIGCDVGKTIRNDLAMDALTTAIRGIPADLDWIIQNLVNIVTAAIRSGEDPKDDADKLEEQFRLIGKKKEAAIDAYLSGAITADELARMKQIYDDKLAAVRERVEKRKKTACPASVPNSSDLWEQIKAIVTCSQISEPLYRALLESVTVRKNGTLRIRLHHIPQTWHFEIQYHRKSP